MTPEQLAQAAGIPVARAACRCGESRIEAFTPSAISRGGPCRACRRASDAARYAANADAMREASRAKYARDPEKAKAATKSWARRNPDAARANERRKSANRRKSPAYRVNKSIASRLKKFIGERGAGVRSSQMLGFTQQELRQHLERQFLRGMTWDNYGEWHVDHIVPLSSFTITGPNDPELRRAWALPNLRPLWAADNIRKGAKASFLL